MQTESIVSNNVNNNKKIDVLLMVDNTASMGTACTAARSSLAEVSTLMNLINGEPCVRISVIGDYDSSTLNNKQGGFAILSESASEQESEQFLNTYVKPMGGGGCPEAYKTGLNHILRLDTKPKILFMFLDALPHGFSSSLDKEGALEKKYIEENNMLWDWIELTKAVKQAGIRVVTFLTANSSSAASCWKMLGDVVCIKTNSSLIITKAMLWCFNVLLSQNVDPANKLEFTLDNILEPIMKLNMSDKLKTANVEHVLAAFSTFLDVLNAERVMCLTTNDILGKYWRLICGKFRYVDERKYENQCQRIMDKLSQCKEKLSEANKTLLKTWIDNSHNNTEIVREIVKKALNLRGDEKLSDVLILPHELVNTISLDDVLELGRGGCFREVSKLICSINLELNTDGSFCLPENEDEAPMFIPVNVLPEQLFSLIGNLLSSGLMFSKSETFMVSILALRNKYLSTLAYDYLLSNKGKWINWDTEKKPDTDDTVNAFPTLLFPTFWSLNFMRLLKLAPNELLTEEEIAFRDHYLHVAKVIHNHDATVEITTPLMFEGLRPYGTWKRLCPYSKGGCNQERCFTIFPGNRDICGICIIEAFDIDTTYTEDYLHPDKIIEKDPLKTHWAQCISCRGNYGVACPQHLNVRPKCHDCRLRKQPQLIECTMCLNKFVNPSGSAQIALSDALKKYSACSDMKSIKCASIINNIMSEGEFVCPRCIDQSSDMVMQLEVKISELFSMNSELKQLVSLTPYEDLINTHLSLWKRVMKCEKTVNIITENDITRISYNSYTVHNPKIVAKTITETLTNHSGFETCQLCVSDVPVHNMVSACGNCRNRICVSCVKGWYSQVEIGSLVTQSHCACPFCKKAPKFDTIKGLDIRHIRNLRTTKYNKGDVCEWDRHYVYGVCRDCLNLKSAITRECAGEDLPIIKNFVCTDCHNIRANLLLEKSETAYLGNVKLCPNCQIETERSGGCHHITCPVLECQTHWCWVCEKGAFEDGTLFDSHTIYDHMSNCGGIFPGDIRD